MISSKTQLKAIKTSIDSAKYADAAEKATLLVKQDSQNYIALIFLGYAREKLAQDDEAEEAYQNAVKIKPTDVQAFRGLINLYEKQASDKLDQYHDIVSRLAKIYADQEDRAQCQNVVDKYELFARKNGSRSQYRRALELLLPTSSLYDALEGRVPHPSHTYGRILESAEADETDWINNQIGERRTKLGAKIDQVTQQVKCEAISKFAIAEKYDDLISWTTDDDARHTLEEKSLRRAFDNLLAFPKWQKPAQRDKVLTLANGMVIIKHPFNFAWKLAMDWVDADSLQDWDAGIFRDYIDFFPEEGLSKVLRGFLGTEPSISPSDIETPMSEIEPGINEKLSEADRLILMTEGLEDCSESLLAQRMMADMYLSLNEHQSTVDAARKAQQLHLDAMDKYGVELLDSLDAVNLTLGIALISYQSPRHHPESKSIFETILQRKPRSTAALLGTGLILEEDEDYHQAVDFLQMAAERDQSNVRIQLELAWCRALGADLEHGLEELQRLLDIVSDSNLPDMTIRAELLYRIAYCKWHLEPSALFRRKKEGPYRYLIDSIKANPSYAPAYTLLGIYFQDYSKSKQRARVALQKAFELSTSEIGAAERLATLFASTAEWDLVELVAQRVVDSGKARSAPGSKRKSFSWPYAALGVVQTNKQQYQKSIVSFQAALRISPNDYHSWVGLGESYHNAGRYVAATRTFMKAESLEHGLPAEQTWFAKYMLANVHREMSAFDEAILGYEGVLDIVKDEFGVLIALLQTLSESAWAKIGLGMFGEATKSAVKALTIATHLSQARSYVFNMWKAVGDACSVLAMAETFAHEKDLNLVSELLRAQHNVEDLATLANLDDITLDTLSDAMISASADEGQPFLIAAILANKMGVLASAQDFHARAVAWYNLGWAEYQAYMSTNVPPDSRSKRSKRFIKASMRCFKRAIEFEAGNPDFWNALGVVTMTLSPKVSQHSFVRGLHLNDNSARTWTNLGALYLVSNDTQLANEAFTRAQSAEPEYAHAWIGQGLIATLYGNVKEARGLFLHAFEIADSSSIPAKQHYAVSAFDHLIRDAPRSHDVTNLLQPLFALRQLRSQSTTDYGLTHLGSLFAERMGSFDEAADTLKGLSRPPVARSKTSSSEETARMLQAKADLARAYLGQGKWEHALESARFALDGSADAKLGIAHAGVRHKLRLSAHITTGLAYFRNNRYDAAVESLRSALDESSKVPELSCMLAQVLWAQDDHDAARDELFECIETHPGHVQATMLLAVVGLLDDDQDILEAVDSDLRDMRISDKISTHDKLKVGRILAAIVASRPKPDGEEADLAPLIDATNAVMLAPGQPQGWSALADAMHDAFSAKLALKNAMKQIPPGGTLGAEDLATALANTEKQEDILQSIVIAPWKEGRYKKFTEIV